MYEEIIDKQSLLTLFERNVSVESKRESLLLFII